MFGLPTSSFYPNISNALMFLPTAEMTSSSSHFLASTPDVKRKLLEKCSTNGKKSRSPWVFSSSFVIDFRLDSVRIRTIVPWENVRSTSNLFSKWKRKLIRRRSIRVTTTIPKMVPVMTGKHHRSAVHRSPPMRCLTNWNRSTWQYIPTIRRSITRVSRNEEASFHRNELFTMFSFVLIRIGAFAVPFESEQTSCSHSSCAQSQDETKTHSNDLYTGTAGTSRSRIRQTAIHGRQRTLLLSHHFRFDRGASEGLVSKSSNQMASTGDGRSSATYDVTGWKSHWYEFRRPSWFERWSAGFRFGRMKLSLQTYLISFLFVFYLCLHIL